MEREQQVNELQKFATLERVREVVANSGLQRREQQKFRLTPDRLELDMDCLRQFEAIGEFCIAYFKTLDALLRKAINGEFPSDMNNYVKEALGRSVARGNRRLQQEIAGFPLMFRTDCVLARDFGGRRRIFVTEIEGERPIGLGFEQLANQMSEVINQTGGGDVVCPIGGVEGLKLVLEENKGRFGEEPLAVILSEDQLFYLEEQSFFAKVAQAAGIPIELVRERDLNVNQSEGLLLPSLGVRTHLLMCLPILNPQKSNKVNEGRELFFGSLNGRFEFIQPPRKMFGTKAGMALLFIPYLERFFAENGINFDTVRDNVPKSKIISGNCFETERLMLESGEQPNPPVMVKAIGMSAARGMALPDDKEGTQSLLRQAKSKQFEFMTQEFVDTEEVEFNIFDEASGKFVREPQFMRLTAYFINLNGKAILTEVEGTGLANRLVHGNSRCIFFPVAFRKD